MQIKIGPLCYSVETVKDLKNDEGDGLFGEIKYAGQIIRLEEEMTPERAFVVLWHEVLHAIDDQYRLCLGEQGVGTLATALVSLFQENPELKYGELVYSKTSVRKSKTRRPTVKRNRKAETRKEQRRLSLQESQLKQTAILLTEMESAAAAVLTTDFNFTEAQATQFLELLRARYQAIQAKVPAFASPKQRLGLLAQRVALAGMQVLSEGYGFGPVQNDAWLKRLIEEGEQGEGEAD